MERVGRIQYIDGLRAVAVLSVLGWHTYRRGTGWAIFPIGFHGVDLFFVLSGFCLSYPTLLKLRTTGEVRFDLASYFSRRLVRIVPLYWITIALLFAFSPTFPLVDVLKQAVFDDYHPHWLTTTFWSLAVEFRWYFLFPAALWLWVQSPRFFAIALGAITALGLQFSTSYDVICLPAFMLGIAAADLRVQGHQMSKYAAPLFIFTLMLSIFALPIHNYWYVRQTWGLIAFLGIVATGDSPLLERMVSLSALRQIGIASYSIYLIHMPILDALQRHNVRPGPWISLPTGLCIGLAFWFVFERQLTGTKLRDKLTSTVYRALLSLAKKSTASRAGAALMLQRNWERETPELAASCGTLRPT